MARVDRHEAREERDLTGPQPRRVELAAALTVFREYFRGMRAFHGLRPCITVFGSAHRNEEHPQYQLVREAGSLLAQANFIVMTGGGPGLMEAANRGAREAGGRSVACTITLPWAENTNPYVDQVVLFRRFFVRKTMLVKYSHGFVAGPGGLGTFDEVFAAATLVHTGKIKNFPIVLLGRDFWNPIVSFLDSQVNVRQMADCTPSHFFVTDSPADAVDHICRTVPGSRGVAERNAPHWPAADAPR